MNPIDLGVIFTLGLVSSLHCVQMCGPIVLSYSVAVESLNKRNDSPILPALLGNHVAYNSGRILTYSALGAIAGTAGHSMVILGRLAGFGHALAIVAGVAMILVGIALLGVIPTRFGSFLRVPTAFLKRIGVLVSGAGSANRFLLGLAMGFLPCGLIYAALLKAMATGSALAGAMTMLAFGSGTGCALLAIGLFSSAVRMRVNRWGSQLAAISVMATGVLLVWRGTLPGMAMMHGHTHVGH
jgi:uncharacterized protein